MGYYKIISSGASCRFCGQLFANSEARDRHEGIHLLKAKKSGLVPRFLYDPKTGNGILKGLKMESDF